MEDKKISGFPPIKRELHALVFTHGHVITVF